MHDSQVYFLVGQAWLMVGAVYGNFIAWVAGVFLLVLAMVLRFTESC